MRQYLCRDDKTFFNLVHFYFYLGLDGCQVRKKLEHFEKCLLFILQQIALKWQQTIACADKNVKNFRTNKQTLDRLTKNAKKSFQKKYVKYKQTDRTDKKCEEFFVHKQKDRLTKFFFTNKLMP